MQESSVLGLCRYAIAMTGLSLLVLFGEGWQGPLSVMVTLALPPEIKSFAVSLFFALAQLIGPSGTVLYGIYLTVSALPTAQVGLQGTTDPLVDKHVSLTSCFDTSTISTAMSCCMFHMPCA